MASRYADLDRPPLRVESLTRALVRDGSMWRTVRVVQSIGSTNAAVVAEADQPEGLVVVAEQQTSGRGRLGREWTSPARAGLTFSFLLRPDVPEARWTWLPLLAGLAIAEATSEMANIDVALKWPNDLLIGDKKVGGILVERHGHAVVVGVGINVTTTQDELPVAEATSLTLAGAAVSDRESLLRAVLRAIGARYAEWQSSPDDSALASAYTDRCRTIESDVTVTMPDGSTLSGPAARVDEHGRLVVVTDDGEHAVRSGDVMHVRPT
jgi:BirA family biotin operon repressor/biotin-[acetyl-CoA-carboxylase] ligase